MQASFLLLGTYSSATWSWIAWFSSVNLENTETPFLISELVVQCDNVEEKL